MPSNRRALTIDGATGKIDSPPRRERVRPIRLDTLSAIRTELGSIYRLARAGRITTSDLTKFAYTLRQLADMTALVDLELRLSALEQLGEPE
jgi:hypothetical protein